MARTERQRPLGRADAARPARPRLRRPPSAAFYRHVMATLERAGIPFLVGGTYAMAHFTGLARPTKDLDLFLRRDSLDRALQAIERTGYRTELTHPHFLGKAYAGAHWIDWARLVSRFGDHWRVLPGDANLCRGTLLSRSQYLHDVEHLGFSDARLEPIGSMTTEETELWTKAIGEEQKKK